MARGHSELSERKEKKFVGKTQRLLGTERERKWWRVGRGPSSWSWDWPVILATEGTSLRVLSHGSVVCWLQQVKLGWAAARGEMKHASSCFSY